ncbi:C-C motif chemokine 3-like [Boleophthalmus pectinirostris]|uniref:C-C motif chemokine 3-like n=1 Tax=Boleophthalmus pectinirostris TaxID=150288 RepID=UPI0024309602|nr:C-C motif chemokine 3-like [Boleophthalmus pectinirostris]
MKTVWLLTGLLLTALGCSCMPWGVNAASPRQCCFAFSTKKIDPSLILSVDRTSSSCSKRGYIVTTPNGKVCVDLSQTWVPKLN